MLVGESGVGWLNATPSSIGCSAMMCIKRNK